MDDKKLIHLLKKNDSRAQKKFYNKYVGAVYAFVNRYMSNNQDAEEITADVFLKVFDKIHQYEVLQNATLWSWMKKISLNECLMKLRKEKNHIQYSDEITDDVTDDNMDALSQLSIRDIHNAINRLPVGYRTVFNLYFMESMTHREISELLDISEQTSKSQLFKAKKSLKEIIKRS